MYIARYPTASKVAARAVRGGFSGDYISKTAAELWNVEKTSIKNPSHYIHPLRLRHPLGRIRLLHSPHRRRGISTTDEPPISLWQTILPITMETNGDVSEAVKPNGEQSENEKKRQIEVSNEEDPATKRARVGNGDEVAANTEALQTETEVKPLAKGTAPVKPE